MSDFDAATEQWLQSLKLGRSSRFLTDFKNGYNFGLILQKLHLAGDRQFKNSSDLACVFQNFKNTRDLLLQKFSVEFPLQNIMYKCEQLLQVLRQCCEKHSQQQRQRSLQQSALSMQPQRPSSLQGLVEERHLKKKQQHIREAADLSVVLPPKLHKIQAQLQKYRDEKTKHQLAALEMRKREMAGHRTLIESHRQFELMKVRQAHDKTTNLVNKVQEVCFKTDQIKLQRIVRQKQLAEFLQGKQQDIKKQLREEEERAVNQGLEDFKLNCLRQGIELEADPARVNKRNEDDFNAVVVMERIKDKMEDNVKQHKERIKRENRKNVETKEAGVKAQTVWNQNQLVKDLTNKMIKQMDRCMTIQRNRLTENGLAQLIKEKYKIKNNVQLPVADQSMREEQYRRKKIIFYQAQTKRLQAQLQYRRKLAANAISALISVTIEGEDTFQNRSGFSFLQWKNLQQQFIDFKEKKKPKTMNKQKTSLSQEAINYLQGKGKWGSDERNQAWQLGNYLLKLIDTVEPPILPPQPSDLPLQMPVKLTFIGPSFAGKTTLSERIASHFGLVLINPKNIIKQALQSIKEVPQDPKKKKETKKLQQQSPEKIALKKFGEEIASKIVDPEAISQELLIKAIIFKIRTCFIKNNPYVQFEESKKNEVQRYARAMKQFQDAAKKKKDPKKEEEVPISKKYFYSSGFVVDTDSKLLKQIEKAIKGYIPANQLKNKKAQTLKSQFSGIIPMPQQIIDLNLKEATFDLVVELGVNLQTLKARGNNEQQIKLTYLKELKQFYHPFGERKANTKTYRCIQNNNSVEDGLKQLIKIIEENLDFKYKAIQQKQINQTQTAIIIQNQDSHNNQFQIQPSKGKQLLHQLQILYTNTSLKVEKSLQSLDKIRTQFSSALLNVQQNFVSIILRPNDKTGRILGFQQNYNSFRSEQVFLVKDTEATKQLIDKLDVVYQSLWDFLQQKKNEGIQTRKQFLTGQWLQSQLRILIFCIKNLFELELNYVADLLVYTLSLATGMQISKGQKIQLQEHSVSYIDQQLQSPLLNKYAQEVQQWLKNTQKWLKDRHKKSAKMLQQNAEINAQGIKLVQDTIKRQIKRSKLRINSIIKMGLQRIREEAVLRQIIANKMDDWIINGIKSQNDFVYGVYKSIQKCILQGKQSNLHYLRGKQITQIHRTLTLPTRIIPFNDSSLFTCCLQLRCLAVKGRIPFKVFQAYWQKRVRSKLLNPQLLALDLDTMQQFLVIDESCSYYELMLALTFVKQTVLEEEASVEFKRGLELKGKQMTFQSFQLPKQLNINHQERKQIHSLLFEVFAHQNIVSTSDYLQSWKIFEQLQLIHYGDAVMLRS